MTLAWSSRASIGCTKEEMASLCGVAHSVVFKHLLENPEIQEVIDRGYDMGRTTLRRAQWKGAVVDGNPTMLIWLGKQLLGQRDSQRRPAAGWEAMASPVIADPQRDTHP